MLKKIKTNNYNICFLFYIFAIFLKINLKMSNKNQYDLVCVGGGIMSANLALLTKILNPNKKILIVERLDDVAKESTDELNNAGTGHSALCELNYTPEKNGKIKLKKAVEICQRFEISKQFWCYLVEEKLIENPSDFIHPVHHYSWVLGKENADYLEKRYHALKEHFMFDTIEYTRDKDEMLKWFPLIAENRADDEIMAGSRINRGTEVNFGVLTHKMYNILDNKYGTKVRTNTEVINISKINSGWEVKVKDLKTNKKHNFTTSKVFLGAGGGSLPLLQKTGIKEGKGYGGFPVGGQFLICNNKELIEKHNVKVYSKAGIGEPPMSTPHLDTRYLNGEKTLFFGPFAGLNPKFLKKGSYFDLFKSIKFDNIIPMLQVFFSNLGLSKYLLKQILMSKEDKIKSLQTFVKDAKIEDWDIIEAGQRVQVIKKNKNGKGRLQFGTEVLGSEDGSVTCLLGASPGASSVTATMLKILEKAFPELLNSEEGKAKLDKIVPFYNKELNEEFFKSELARCKEILKL